jgi:putative hydrolase of HD superfamily
MVLKRIPRSGWKNIGIENPDSVAEHVFLTSQIAYVLGKMEKVDAERAALLSLFHDNGEARVGDLNLVTKFYFKNDKAESKAFFDQIKNLPCEDEMKKIYDEWKEQKTPEAIVARDADWTEMALQAKHYFDLGNKKAKLWIEWYKTCVKTKSAKKLIEIIEKTNIDDWWKEIPEIKREIKKLKKK